MRKRGRKMKNFLGISPGRSRDTLPPGAGTHSYATEYIIYAPPAYKVGKFEYMKT